VAGDTRTVWHSAGTLWPSCPTTNPSGPSRAKSLTPSPHTGRPPSVAAGAGAHISRSVSGSSTGLGRTCACKNRPRSRGVAYSEAAALAVYRRGEVATRPRSKLVARSTTRPPSTRSSKENVAVSIPSGRSTNDAMASAKGRPTISSTRSCRIVYPPPE